MAYEYAQAMLEERKKYYAEDGRRLAERIQNRANRAQGRADRVRKRFGNLTDTVDRAARPPINVSQEQAERLPPPLPSAQRPAPAPVTTQAPAPVATPSTPA